MCREALKFIDAITLGIFAILVFLSVIGMAVYDVSWPFNTLILSNIFNEILLFIALIKVYVYFDKDRITAIIGLLLLSFFLMLHIIGQCNYEQVISLIVAMMGIRIEKIIKVYVATTGTTLLITFIAAITGMIFNGSVLIPSRVVKQVYYLGFSGHNPPMALWLFFSLALLYLIKDTDKNIIIVFIMICITICLYLATGSNTSFIIAIVCHIAGLVNFIIVERKKSKTAIKISRNIAAAMIFVPLISILITVVGLIVYGKYGRTEHLTTLSHRYEILYWEFSMSGVKMPFQALRDVNAATVDFSYFLSEDITSEVYKNIDFNLFRGLGTLTRGQLFGGSDIEYGNILLYDGLMVLFPYRILSIYLLYRVYRKKEYILMICIVASVFYGNFEALKSGYTVCQIMLLPLFANVGSLKMKKQL